MLSRRIVLTLLLAGGAAGAFGQEHADGPEAMVTAFYAVHLANPIPMLPDAPQLERLRPFLTDRLRTLFVDARRYQDDWIARHPNQKAPCGEGGDSFDSLNEWPTVRLRTDEDPRQEFEIRGTAKSGRRRWHVRVRFWYDTIPVVEWEDVVVVTQERDRFLIDDVRYADGPFNRGGRLSERLAECAKD